MFSVLKVGGDFILRMFDLNTKFSIDVVYILYRYFSKIAICKPYSSRACENERFIICKGLQKNAPDNILEHLFEANNGFVQDSGSKVISFKDQVRSSVSDVLSLLRPGIVTKDEDFIDSIQGSNMKYICTTNFIDLL
jgi:cap1 methyltransferase